MQQSDVNLDMLILVRVSEVRFHSVGWLDPWSHVLA